MRFFYVESPSAEDEADGLDRREWFTSKGAAVTRFRQFKRMFEKHARRITKIEAIPDDEDRYLARSEYERNRSPGYQWYEVEIGYVDLRPTKQGLFAALQRNVRYQKIDTFKLR